jgi:signal transduction histidine kinase
MRRPIIFRLIVYFAAIVSLATLIGWTAHTSWLRIGKLHNQLKAKQWQSFQVAADLQKSILALNNLMLRYVVYHNEDDWSRFFSSSQDLTWWLNEQRPILSAQEEKPFLDDINAAYKDYLAVAKDIKTKHPEKSDTIIRMEEFTELEKQSKRIVGLSIDLSKAHQQSIELLQAQSLQALNFLRSELLAALVILLALVFWLAVVVYREMISPLQVQLVESRQLVERNEKLASLGMLAAGVAHEIRNPLTAIKAWLYLQQKHLKPGTPEYGDAELIGGEITRLERIVKDFLQFARPSDPEFTITHADLPLKEAQRLMQPELEKAGIHIVLGETVTDPIRIDPQQIKQVLLNLIQNAADSIGQNGTVTLGARLNEKRINGKDTPVVILEVTDTGKGIPHGAEKRLFDPFFTTKSNGTGLGLPIAARIVEKHEGALQYQTQHGHGTTFGIILPRQKLEPDDQAAARQE